MELNSAWNNKKKKKQAFWDPAFKKMDQTYLIKEKVLFRWMCIHVTIDGTSTSNPKRGNVFEYIYHAIH